MDIQELLNGFDIVHEGFGSGERNEASNLIINFGFSYDMILVNTWFKRVCSHLITFRNGLSASQIDFFLTRKVDTRQRQLLIVREYWVRV